MTEKVKLKPKDRPHYVSNKDFFQDYMDWYQAIKEAKEANLPEPDIPNSITVAVMKICTRLAYSPNFYNYSYRDDMVGDAIENCTAKVKNFDPEKSINPFSFITTIAFNAFLRRIALEKRQTYIKGKMISELPIDEIMDIQDMDENMVTLQTQYLEFLRENSYIIDESIAKKKKVGIVLEDEENLSEFLMDVIDEIPLEEGLEDEQ